MLCCARLSPHNVPQVYYSPRHELDNQWLALVGVNDGSLKVRLACPSILTPASLSVLAVTRAR